MNCPAQSPELAPSVYNPSAPLQDAQRGRHFADNSELKLKFRDVLRSRGRDFYNTGIQGLTQRWQKCIKMKTFWGKNNLIIEKDVQIIYLKFIVTALIFFEKK
jgi:hypothetical protein